MFKLILKPVILISKTDKNANRFSVLGKDNIPIFRQSQKLCQFVFYFGERHFSHSVSPFAVNPTSASAFETTAKISTVASTMS